MLVTDPDLFDGISVVGKIYEQVKYEIKTHMAVCIYSLPEDIAKFCIIPQLKRYLNIDCEYVFDGANGFIQRCKM